MKALSVFITIKDMMRLHGNKSYESMRRLHLKIRTFLTSKANIAKGKIKSHLTVHEYCQYEQVDEQEILDFLKMEEQRGKQE